MKSYQLSTITRAYLNWHKNEGFSVAKRRKEKKIYKYECTLTGESYKVTDKAQNPDDLVSVKAFYELNPDKDDRPQDIKKQLGIEVDQ